MKQAKRYDRLNLRLIESQSSDAFAIAGGHLLITRGLLKTCESEAALVGVLAHELSHLDRGHLIIPLKQLKLARQPISFQKSMMWINLVTRPLRPEQEREADSDATEWMMAVGYSPRELASLLNRWDQQQQQTMPWMQFIPGFVKTHPNPGKRSRDVLLAADKLKLKFPEATYVGAQNLRQLTPKAKPQLP
ncbi:M48 family metallopeptidase [Rosistilla carotiformis]|nr:M48 family metallopeptidase [Rosistilla carotiformis]